MAHFVDRFVHVDIIHLGHFNASCFSINIDLFRPKKDGNLFKMSNDFYLRYYVGHKGKFGHEFLEFEFRPDGKLRYANNSNYKNDTMIRY